LYFYYIKLNHSTYIKTTIPNKMIVFYEIFDFRGYIHLIMIVYNLIQILKLNKQYN
jgi:hypothetical protein